MNDYFSTVQCETIAGSIVGCIDGSGIEARFSCPEGICVDNRGNIYVADTDNSKIRKITQSGVVSTLAGSAEGFQDGPTSTSKFRSPGGLCVDVKGNIYVADTDNHKIRKISVEGQVTTIAGKARGFQDGVGSAAKFNGPTGICVDKEGNLYVADLKNDKIRKISENGTVTTLAGTTRGFSDGPVTSAQFNGPAGVTVDSNFNVYVADLNNDKIRKVSNTGTVSTLAGSTPGFMDGIGTAAQFNGPAGICIDNYGTCYIAELNNDRLRKLALHSTCVSTLAGSIEGFSDGIGPMAMFNGPVGISVDNQGNIFIADKLNHKIRKLSEYCEQNIPAPSKATYADFEIKVGQQVFCLHKAILAIRCPNLLQKLPACSSSLFQQIIKFIYKNTFIEMDKLSHDDVIQLLQFCKEFEMLELQKIVHGHILQILNSETLFEFFILIYKRTKYVKGKESCMDQEFNWLVAYFVKNKVTPPAGFLSQLSEECKDQIMLELLQPTLTCPPIIEPITLQSISNVLQVLFQKSIHFDFQIIIGEHKFQIHKFILYRWKFFTSVLSKSSTDTCYHETNMPPLTFRKMLEFLYTGCVDNFTLRDCGWIASMSGYYLLDEPRLLQYCQKVIDAVNEESWPEALQLGVELGDVGLQKSAISCAENLFPKSVIEFLHQQFKVHNEQRKQAIAFQKIIFEQKALLEKQNLMILGLAKQDSGGDDPKGKNEKFDLGVQLQSIEMAIEREFSLQTQQLRPVYHKRLSLTPPLVETPPSNSGSPSGTGDRKKMIKALSGSTEGSPAQEIQKSSSSTRKSSGSMVGSGGSLSSKKKKKDRPDSKKLFEIPENIQKATKSKLVESDLKKNSFSFLDKAT